ncbi:MAG: CcmA2, partial [Thermoanaerobacter thermocopriae]
MVEVDGLTKVFKNIRAVDNLSFRVEEGEIYGLLGENGAGKTTTLRMLATMLKPTNGTAIINGKDLIKEPEEIRKEVGILFGGESGLYDRLTARENILYFAELHDMDKK